jgi:hypothetical protein
MAALSELVKHPDLVIPAPANIVGEEAGWQASLKLGYAAKGGKSMLLHQDRRGPLFVQKTF